MPYVYFLIRSLMTVLCSQFYNLLFSDEETKAQRYQETCPRSHSLEMTTLESEPKTSRWQNLCW